MKWKKALIVFLVIFALIYFVIYIDDIYVYITESFWNIVIEQLDREESERLLKNKNGEVVRGKDTLMIWNDHFELWKNNNEINLSIFTKEHDGILLKKVSAFDIDNNYLYVISEEGYAIIDKNNFCRIFIVVSDEDFANGVTEDKDENENYINRHIENEYIRYLDNYNDFSVDEQNILKEMVTNGD